jgi:hypothetical protein
MEITIRDAFYLVGGVIVGIFLNSLLEYITSFFTRKKKIEIISLERNKDHSPIEWIAELENGKMLGILYMSGCLVGTISKKKTSDYLDIYKKGNFSFCDVFHDDYKCLPAIEKFLKQHNFIIKEIE